MDDDGSNQTLLTDEFRPRASIWSPDGSQIAFKGFVQNSSVIYLMNPDGTNIRQITEIDDSRINVPSFSPDGKFIVFNRWFQFPNKPKDCTVVLNIETGKMKEISDFWGIQHNWSSDGKHIICAEPWTIGVNNTIWIMEANGINLQPLIPVAFFDGEFTIRRESPRWSPNSQQIVYVEMEWKTVRLPNARFEGPFYKAFRIMIYNHNGGDIRSLPVPKGMECFCVDWMDDGKSIVFSARAAVPLNKPLPHDFEFPPPNIYKYHIQTRDMTRLTEHPGSDYWVDWISDDVLSVSPIGKKKVMWGRVK
ncbi:PD40 domain-containing protein [Candidatus Poribacteria bacterium]|nr:PD40 domain-containing protein [Candidatus Poribacteria bacterium]